MTELTGSEHTDIVTIKEEIASSLRGLPCPGNHGISVWRFLRDSSRRVGPVPAAVRAVIRAEVEKRVAGLGYGGVIELWQQTDIGWSSDESMADYITEAAARSEVISQLVPELVNWAGVELWKEENPDWKQKVLE